MSRVDLTHRHSKILSVLGVGFVVRADLPYHHRKTLTAFEC